MIEIIFEKINDADRHKARENEEKKKEIEK